MTLRHMKIYVTVFQHCNITRAAEELHLAQPSVSLAVKELEEYYGVQLFERRGRRILPTEAGREFYGYALHIASLFDEMETRIKNWDKIGTLRIGTSITIGTHILPDLLHRFQKQFPEVRIETEINNSSIIEQRVLDNAIDIGLIENQPEHGDIHAAAFMQDELCAIVPPGHPLGRRKKVTLEQLAEAPFLMREKGSAGREILDAAFELLQKKIHPVMESVSTQAIVKGVSEGLGVAVLPYLLVRRDIEEGVVEQVPLAEPIERNLNIIYHKSKYLTGNMNAFMELCKQYGEGKEADINPEPFALRDSIPKEEPTDELWVLESNIDDCTGETLGYTLDLLFEAGARDAWFTPIFMKKNRPAYKLSVLCEEERIRDLDAILFRETTTIGVRRYRVQRDILKRRFLEARTPDGTIRVKVCELPGGGEKYYPEYEDVKRVARETGKGYREVYEMAQQAVSLDCVRMPGQLHHGSAKQEQGNQVGDRHKTVEGVGNAPEDAQIHRSTENGHR